MPDTTPQGGNPAGQAPEGAQAAQNQPSQQTTQPPSNAGGGTGQASGSGLSAEQIQAELAEARREAAKYRTERNSFEAELKKRQDAELSETERLKKQFEETTTRASALESQLRQERLNLLIEREARRLNIVDSEAASLFLAGKVEFDDQGQPKDVGTLLEGLVKQKPWLVASATAAAAPGAGAAKANPGQTPSSAGRTFTRAQLMDSKFYAENRDAIMQAYREGRITD
jgi:hypothetical protein